MKNLLSLAVVSLLAVSASAASSNEDFVKDAVAGLSIPSEVATPKGAPVGPLAPAPGTRSESQYATKTEAESAPNRSIEEIMQGNDTVVVDNPLFGGLPFLAVTARENYNGEQNNQKKRAVNLCKMLGYDKPILAAVRWISKDQSAISVDDEGNGTAAVYSFLAIGISTPLGPSSDYYSWAVFSKIACKGKSKDAR